MTGTMLYNGTSGMMPPALLPAGQDDMNNDVTINVRVTDSLGAWVSLPLVVKV